MAIPFRLPKHMWVIIVLQFVIACRLLAVEATSFRFLSSCDTANYTDAIERCDTKNGAVFSIEDLVYHIGTNNIVHKAVEEHQIIWVNKTKLPVEGTNCTVALRRHGKITFEHWDCLEELHYVCKVVSDDGRVVSFNESYVPCRKETGSRLQLVPIAITASVCLFVIIIVFVIFLCQRMRQPVKYDVRGATAIRDRRAPGGFVDIGTACDGH